MIEIRALNKTDLAEYIKTEEYREGAFIPISSHRAHSHINNPRSNNEDTLMLLAYSEQVLIGYLGVLADWIFEADGTRHKCGWLSCMWIDPTHRGKGISKKLVREALERWDQKILVTEFTAAAKGLYDKVGAFKDLQTLSGTRLYRRLNLAKILPPKGSLFNKNKWLLAQVDRLANFFLDIRFTFTKTVEPTLASSYFNTLGPKEIKYLNEKKDRHLFQRGARELTWMLAHPWISTDQAAYSEASRYHFSAAEKIFHFTGLTFSDADENITALMVFSVRGANLKIPYCYYDEGMEDIILQAIFAHLKKWKINTVTIFHPGLVKRLQKERTDALYKKTISRHFIISKALTNFDSSTSYLIQDGDGDCAFT